MSCSYIPSSITHLFPCIQRGTLQRRDDLEVVISTRPYNLEYISACRALAFRRRGPGAHLDICSRKSLGMRQLTTRSEGRSRVCGSDFYLRHQVPHIEATNGTICYSMTVMHVNVMIRILLEIAYCPWPFRQIEGWGREDVMGKLIPHSRSRYSHRDDILVTVVNWTMYMVGYHMYLSLRVVAIVKITRKSAPKM